MAVFLWSLTVFGIPAEKAVHIFHGSANEIATDKIVNLRSCGFYAAVHTLHPCLAFCDGF